MKWNKILTILTSCSILHLSQRKMMYFNQFSVHNVHLTKIITLDLCRFHKLFSRLLTSENSFFEQWTIKVYGTWRVIVSRNRVCYKVWIAICVDYTHTRYTHLCCMYHSQMLSWTIKGIEKDAQIRQPCNSFELRCRIRKYALSPKSCVRKLFAFLGCFVHQIAGLRILWDKQDYTTSVCNMSSKIQCLSQQLSSLIQVNDQISHSRSKYECLHVLIHGSFFVTIVHSSII